MPALNILVLSHYFPPEVAAVASRVHETARVWTAAGHRVTVVTCVPNHPAGNAYPGYANRLWQREYVDGIAVLRLWTYMAANRGVVRRTLNYLSYLVSVVAAMPWLPAADVVVSTSPQFFCGLAGYPLSRWKRAPWVLEIRDLWPQSIVAVGALKPNAAIRLVQRLERFAYRRARHIVSASPAFRAHFEACGVERGKVSVIPNGVDLALFAKPAAATEFRARHGLKGKFVAGYVGTHGMAHRLDVILQAADRLRGRSDIHFLLVGDGAEREHLVERCRSMALPNVLMLPQMDREHMPTVWAACDAALVVLREDPVFELVVPSKMFEAMIMRRPILLGVRGQAQRIVENAGCGLTFPPGDAESLANGVTSLAADPALCRELGDNGYRLVTSEYDRTVLARQYLALLEQTVAGAAGSGGP